MNKDIAIRMLKRVKRDLQHAKIKEIPHVCIRLDGLELSKRDTCSKNYHAKYKNTAKHLKSWIAEQLGQHDTSLLGYILVETGEYPDPIQIRILFIELMLEALQNPKLGKMYPINTLIRYVETQLP